ncbi:hypothetical protein M427DRAFT_495110 [Gonapodya prolifera JEL478]|uniref:Uncharacterized protein n=1 Tax=Gonapodya prolifera (strain JEL478) TaxID=1344416 RepID=A0A139AIL8_GONPJ|nr:hypothetical protein M427DRAFT_495110 [Gonapodya prolifera JEL478]|eukprot:KXS16549.1 hypothetical protein M427DRAFT_495110 [Gonapodya prolifera JEL478]
MYRVAAVDTAKKADRSGILRQGDRTSFGDEDEGEGVIAREGKKLKEAATKAKGAILGKRSLDAYKAAAYKSLKSHAEEKEAGTSEMSRSTAQLGSDATVRDQENRPVMGMQDEKGQLYNNTKEKN